MTEFGIIDEEILCTYDFINSIILLMKEDVSLKLKYHEMFNRYLEHEREFSKILQYGVIIGEREYELFCNTKEKMEEMRILLSDMGQKLYEKEIINNTIDKIIEKIKEVKCRHRSLMEKRNEKQQKTKE